MNRIESRLFIVLLFSSVFLVGCSFNIGSLEQKEKYTKIVHMPIKPLSPGSDFLTKTHNGSINVLGLDVTDCNIVATIEGRAATEEEAQEIVEKTKLSFKQSDEKLVLKVSKPLILINCSVGVNLDIELPDHVNLNLETYNGRINIENITGDTRAKTLNGEVIVNNITGQTRLETLNGRIVAEEISGDIECHTNNGSITTHFSKNAEPDCNIEMTMLNGSIDLTTPPNYSAHVNASTLNGSVITQLPVEVSGKIHHNKLTGIFRDGQGELKLKTLNGSIMIK